MNKKATLLIKNLYKIYTMEEHPSSVFLVNGFIAIHHDEIMDVGQHDYSAYVDKDTRIIDGRNHIAIPSFIEVNATLPCKTAHSARLQQEFFLRFMHSGTLTIHVQEEQHIVLPYDYHYEVLQGKTLGEGEVIDVIAQMKSSNINQLNEPFCISTRDEVISLQNQMLAAQMLAMKDGICAHTLLKSLTIYPAKYLGLTNYGQLKKGCIANILIVSSRDIHSFFYSFDQRQIAHIIHKGVRVYPNLLI